MAARRWLEPALFFPCPVSSGLPLICPRAGRLALPRPPRREPSRRVRRQAPLVVGDDVRHLFVTAQGPPFDA